MGDLADDRSSSALSSDNGGGRRRSPIDPFEAIAFLAFAGLSVWLLAVLLSKQGPNHIWTGTDGPFIGDQMQYLGWIQDASRHLFVSNPFRTTAGAADYLNPGLAVSGLLVRLGMSASLSYLVWKPVAVVVLFGATRAYAHRMFEGTAQRRIALVLALFYLSPVSAFVGHLGWLPALDRYFLPSVGSDMWPGLYLWGYPFTALAVAALAYTLLFYERDRVAGRLGPWPPLLGLLCSWMQPWQGATLVVVVVVSEVVMRVRGDRPRWAIPLLTAVATALPLAYYSLLSHVDPTWSLAGRENFLVVPALAILVALIPLGLPAVLAYRLRPVDFQSIALRTWPLIALGMYFFIANTHVGTFPLHALQGVSIPFACLAVSGASSIRWNLSGASKIALGVLTAVLLIIPAGIQELNGARSVGSLDPFGAEPYFITTGEQNALSYLKRNPVPGSVLAPVYLGQTVPAETGRQTWVGIFSWTPNYARRVALAEQLFSNRLNSTRAVALVRSSGARFLLSDCQHLVDLNGTLSSVLVGVRHFGCATVYQVSK